MSKDIQYLSEEEQNMTPEQIIALLHGPEIGDVRHKLELLLLAYQQVVDRKIHSSHITYQSNLLRKFFKDIMEIKYNNPDLYYSWLDRQKYKEKDIFKSA